MSSGSRAPPQLMFDDGSRVMIEDSEQHTMALPDNDEPLSSVTPRGNLPLHTYYEIERLSKEVIDLLVAKDTTGDTPTTAKILRVALQFPDELLEDSPEVCWLLEDQIREDLINTNNGDAIDPFCFVLGDTTVNSCCPDEVAALHLNADVLIHYGHACLSPTGTLPVLYSFGRLELDAEQAAETLEAERQKRKQGESACSEQLDKYLLLYQVGYHHAMTHLQEKWKQRDESLQVVVAELPTTSRVHNQRRRRSVEEISTRTSCCQQSEVPATDATMAGGCCGGTSLSPALVSEEADPSGEPSGCCQTQDNSPCCAPSPPASPSTIPEEEIDSEIKNRPSRTKSLVVGGLELPSDQISSWEDLSDYTVVFIMANPEEDVYRYSTDDATTPQQRQYANSMLCFLSLPHGEPGGGYWIYSPRHQKLRTDVSPPPALKRQLKRRFFLTQKARDASVFGILVANLSQQHLVDVVRSLQKLIEDSDRTAYSFAVGKINPAKLANFAEIETFCIVACREHSLLDDEREYPIPVITPMELEIALERKQWGMQAYSLDCQDVLRHAEDEDDGEASDTHAVTDDDYDSVDSDAPYFSMVTGRYESRQAKGLSSANNELDLKALPGQGQVTEYKSEASNFLRQREYQGLESLVGQTAVKAAVLGQRGIAAEYHRSATAEAHTNKNKSENLKNENEDESEHEKEKEKEIEKENESESQSESEDGDNTVSVLEGLFASISDSESEDGDNTVPGLEGLFASI